MYRKTSRAKPREVQEKGGKQAQKIYGKKNEQTKQSKTIQRNRKQINKKQKTTQNNKNCRRE